MCEANQLDMEIPFEWGVALLCILNYNVAVIPPTCKLTTPRKLSSEGKARSSFSPSTSVDFKGQNIAAGCWILRTRPGTRRAAGRAALGTISRENGSRCTTMFFAAFSTAVPYGTSDS